MDFAPIIFFYQFFFFNLNNLTRRLINLKTETILDNMWCPSDFHFYFRDSFVRISHFYET